MPTEREGAASARADKPESGVRYAGSDDAWDFFVFRNEADEQSGANVFSVSFDVPRPEPCNEIDQFAIFEGKKASRRLVFCEMKFGKYEIGEEKGIRYTFTMVHKNPEGPKHRVFAQCRFSFLKPPKP